MFLRNYSHLLGENTQFRAADYSTHKASIVIMMFLNTLHAASLLLLVIIYILEVSWIWLNNRSVIVNSEVTMKVFVQLICFLLYIKCLSFIAFISFLLVYFQSKIVLISYLVHLFNATIEILLEKFNQFLYSIFMENAP